MYSNFEVHSSFLIQQRIDHLNAHKTAYPLAADVDKILKNSMQLLGIEMPERM